MAGEGSKLELFFDPGSQPARAVLIFCRINQLDVEEVTIHLVSQDHKKPEFLKINPEGQVPAIDDGGFTLFESHAILRYLATSRETPDHWYPKNVKQRGLIDSVLDWHHSNTRRGATSFWFNRVVGPLMGLPTDAKVDEESKKLLLKALDMLDNFWCKDGPFLCGAEQVSIADISLACELMQLKFLDGPELSELYAARKNVTKWLHAVETATNPVFEEAHSFIYDLHKQVKAKKAAAEAAHAQA